MQAVVDENDVCQAVLASFFVRASLGQYDLEEPAQLERLLCEPNRRKCAMKLNSAQVEQTLSPLEAQVIPDAHPMIPK